MPTAAKSQYREARPGPQRKHQKTLGFRASARKEADQKLPPKR
jgi:hypothetical protein